MCIGCCERTTHCLRFITRSKVYSLFCRLSLASDVLVYLWIPHTFTSAFMAKIITNLSLVIEEMMLFESIEPFALPNDSLFRSL